MKTLNETEILQVAGAGDCKKKIDEPWYREPVKDADSDIGKIINDAARTANDFGRFLGGAIYDATHPSPQAPAPSPRRK
jgi:hypothetical protein